jgi:hypothetical protein
MLCQFCREVDWDTLTEGSHATHHQSFADLVVSAEGGCALCAAICAAEKTEIYNYRGFIDTGCTPDLKQITWSYESVDVLRWYQFGHRYGFASLYVYTTEGMSFSRISRSFYEIIRNDI